MPGETDWYVNHAHNVYAQTIAETGIVGALAGIIVIVSIGLLGDRRGLVGDRPRSTPLGLRGRLRPGLSGMSQPPGLLRQHAGRHAGGGHPGGCTRRDCLTSDETGLGLSPRGSRHQPRRPRLSSGSRVWSRSWSSGGSSRSRRRTTRPSGPHVPVTGKAAATIANAVVDDDPDMVPYLVTQAAAASALGDWELALDAYQTAAASRRSADQLAGPGPGPGQAREAGLGCRRSRSSARFDLVTASRPSPTWPGSSMTEWAWPRNPTTPTFGPWSGCAEPRCRPELAEPTRAWHRDSRD